MARNAERSMAVLNRWMAIKSSISSGGIVRRPHDVTEVTDIRQAEKWRGSLVRELSRSVSEIQNAGLGEKRIRELNDEINKLLRIKAKWEERIVDLGGPDYRHSAASTDIFGDSLSGRSGYKYFGAAKDLPGVRELFHQEEGSLPEMTRYDLYKNIDPGYYGWRDDEDISLLEAEASRDEQLAHSFLKFNGINTEERISEVNTTKTSSISSGIDIHKKIKDIYLEEDNINTNRKKRKADSKSIEQNKVFVNVPSAFNISELLLKKKKMMLLSKYVTPEEMDKSKETSELIQNTES